GSLAVGPGDAGDPQLARWMAVDLIRNRAQLCLEVLDRQMRQLPFPIPAETLRVPQDRVGTASDRLPDIAPPVLVGPGRSRECVAGMHATAVRSESRHSYWELSQQGRCVGVLRGRAAHVSSFTSASSGGRTTLLIGASGGTPSKRKADPITL